MVSGGFGCTTGGNLSTTINADFTYLDTGNTIDVSGNIKSWCVRLATSSTFTVKLKIFRISGSNYNLVWSGEPENIPNNGLIQTVYTFALNSSVPVLSGDIVGFSAQASGSVGSARYDNTSGSGVFRMNGDVLNQTTIASWSSLTGANLRVHASSDILTVQYVKTTGNNSNSGSDWNNSKKDIKDGLRFIGTSGNLHIGFGDYSAMSGIRFDKTVALQCETAGSSGGTGTVTFPTATWSQCDWSNFVQDRSNTHSSGTTDMDASGCAAGYLVPPNTIAIHNAFAQRFVPASRCLKKITLKLQRLFGTVDLFVEIRSDNSGIPLNDPQQATGQIASKTIPYTSITTLTPTDYDITFETDLGDTNPKWIVISLTTYDKSVIDNTEYYRVGWAEFGSINEHSSFRIGTCFSNTWTTSVLYPNMYYYTYRGI